MFVPTSVERYSRGLRRVAGNRWVHVDVLEKMRVRDEMARVQRVFKDITKNDPVLKALKSGHSWGDVICEADAQYDAPYIAMSSEEWIAALKESRTSKKLSRTQIARIHKAREDKKKYKPIVIPAPAPDAEYRYWKNEYTNFGHLYFSSEEQQQEALVELELEYNKKPVNKYSALLDSDSE